MNFRGIYNELKRRNVIKVATVYAITAWLIAQIVQMAAGAFAAPPWVMKMVIVLLLVGFPLALIFAWAFELTPEGLKKTNHVPKAASQTDHTGSKLNWMIIGALILLLVFVSAERIFFAGSYADEPPTAEFTNASIAVLPFDNISSNTEEDAYFSDGLSEELLNTLAGVDSMKVAGRTSSFRFKGDNLDMKQIGEQLGVRNILEGSVRKAGKKVRITVQLINAQDGNYIWSQTYDRTLDDIFMIQEDISKKVLAELKVRLLPKAKQQLETIPTGDVESYQLYLKANQVIATRNIKDINRAIDLYKQAINLDPSFAKAHARLAMAYALQGDYGNVPMKQVQKNIQSRAEGAQMLNSNLGEAYAAMGLYYQNAGEYQRAARAYGKSLKLNPNQPQVHSWLGGTFYKMGKPDQAINQFKKTYELDPLAPLSLYNYAILHLVEGDINKGAQILRRNIRLNPDFMNSYTGLSEIKGNAPLGQIDSAFIYSHKAFQQDSSNTQSLSLLTIYTGIVDLPAASVSYYHKLRNRFPNSPEYILTSVQHAGITGEYAIIENIVLPYLQQYRIPLRYGGEYFFHPLAAYAYATGNYEPVLKAIKDHAPELFREDPEPIEFDNYSYGYIPIGLFREQDKDEQSRRLTQSYCTGIEQLKGRFEGGEAMGQYNFYKAICLLYQDKPKQALPHVKKYFLEKNGLSNSKRFFENPVFEESLKQPGYQKIRDQVEAMLTHQRENVIQYLKKEGDWKPEWDE